MDNLEPGVQQTVLATPSMTIDGGQVFIGDTQSCEVTPVCLLALTLLQARSAPGPMLKSLAKAPSAPYFSSTGTLLPPGTCLSPMQSNARSEWNRKVLVALKRLTSPFDGGWDECRRLKELQSLRSIPRHNNIIPLYDAFLVPATRHLFLVFEAMEGNLYQLIRSRKGRGFANGLVFSIFQQAVPGLHHIHSSGYIHRDMKPENLLVTTTGLARYSPNMEQDVMVIVKITDFGLARETSSRPPYTEYIAVRWYRSPELLLRARDYSSPVDMWALGLILAEVINLKPLFPGSGEIDQLFRITHVLGEPTDRYGHDECGRVLGGGPWPKGIEMATSHGFMFRESQPVVFATLFPPTIPRSLIDVIQDLLLYDPAARFKTVDLLDCEYVRDMQSQPAPVSITGARSSPADAVVA
ncbi:kinase-like domain-containing protein [Auriculariales sp. MPI-PUGE-AT-0066]|nr:kinase-like domain-containing protein [Auriculariales sp. MPI-PUGE-AT-0066]